MRPRPTFRSPATNVILAIVAFWCVNASRVTADQVKDDSLGFSITIPSDFTPLSEVRASDPDFLYAFGRPSADGALDAIIVIERLKGTIDRTRLDVAHMPAGFKGRHITLPWQSFEIEALEVPDSTNGIETLTYNAQVPLVPNALQIKVFGPRQQAAELQALMGTLLASLDGRTNWIKSALPGPVGNSAAYGWVLLAIALLSMLGGLISIRAVTRGVGRRAALFLCIFLIFIGYAVPRDGVREMRMLSAATRMTGFLGLIVTAATRVRKRPVARMESGSVGSDTVGSRPAA